jgi:hypothetical protein
MCAHSAAHLTPASCDVIQLLPPPLLLLLLLLLQLEAGASC